MWMNAWRQERTCALACSKRAARDEQHRQALLHVSLCRPDRTPLKLSTSGEYISVNGQKEQIDRFLSEIDQRFAEVGWSRESVFEAKMNRDEHQINRFHCWSTAPDNMPRVMLCLNRTTERRSPRRNL